METLAARIERNGALRDIDAVGWVIRLAKRIEALHALGAVHGTISPHCMLIEADACTSIGRLAELQAAQEFPAYHSPERAAGKGPSRTDDVWALAVMMYEALCGLVPYPAARDADVLRAVAAAAPPPLAVFGVGDDELQSILDRALARDPQQRINDIGRLRRLLEAWRPVTRFGALPPLEDAIPEGSELDDDDDFDPDAVTRIRSDVTPMLADFLKMRAPASTPQPAPASTPQPPASTPLPAATRTPLPAVKPESDLFEKSSAGGSRRIPLMAITNLGLGGAAPTGPSSGVEARSAPEPPSKPEGADSPSSSRIAARLPPPPRLDAAAPPDAPVPISTPLPEPPPSAPRFPARSQEPRVLVASPAPELPPEEPIPEPPAASSNRGAMSSSELILEAPSAFDFAVPPSTPDASPSSARVAAGLPSLLDEVSSPEPDDPLAMPASGNQLDAPRRPQPDLASAPAPASSASPAPGPASSPASGPASGNDARKEGAMPSPAAVTAPAAPAPPAPRRRGGLIFAFFVALLGGGAAAWFWGRPMLIPPPPRTVQGVSSATRTASAPPEPAGVVPAMSASAAPEVSASSAAPEVSSADAPTASAEPADTASPAAPATNVTACMVPLFAEDTFDAKAKPNFDFVCSEADPRRGIASLKRQVVLGDTDGSVSDGMREWALLRWYELAAYAVMRAHCCSEAPALKLPASPAPCEPLDLVLNDLGDAAVAAKDMQDEDLNKAVKRFTDEVYCLAKMGGTLQYGHTGPPRGGEDTAFRKTLARVVTKR